MQAKILTLAKEGASLLLRSVGLLVRLSFLERVCIGYASSDFLAVFPPSVRICVASFSGRPECAWTIMPVARDRKWRSDEEPPVVLIVPYVQEDSFQRFLKHLDLLPRQKKNGIRVIGVKESNSKHLRKAWLLNAGIKYAASL